MWMLLISMAGCLGLLPRLLRDGLRRRSAAVPALLRRP